MLALGDYYLDDSFASFASFSLDLILSLFASLFSVTGTAAAGGGGAASASGYSGYYYSLGFELTGIIFLILRKWGI